MKRIISAAVVFLLFWAFRVSACAYTETVDTAAITERIYHESGADELWSAVPDDARDFLGEAGFSGFLPDGVEDITVQSFFESLGSSFRKSLSEPFRVLMCVLAIIIISASLDTVGSDSPGGSLSLVSSLCIVSVIAPPMLDSVSMLADTITASGNFMLLYVPVISGLMIASGKPAGGALYSGVMIFVSSALMQLTVRIIVPMLKCVMSLSLVSSACEKVRLGGVVELFRRCSQFMLTFGMSLFAAFLTMRTIVAAAADSLGTRAAKFAIGSFVPVVGGALSEAYQTVISCVSLLKSGVGAAGIAVVFAIFLPAALHCIMWKACAAGGRALCDMFGLSGTSNLLSQLSNVMSVMFAVLMCTMVIYIISTAILIIVGG